MVHGWAGAMGRGRWKMEDVRCEAGTMGGREAERDGWRDEAVGAGNGWRGAAAKSGWHLMAKPSDTISAEALSRWGGGADGRCKM
ncbi:MAG: hypothetical protein K6F94_01930 [Bacteroidaceae bacterium]|nr:hypothetical protein [Bacteroidaceae bacterium]